MTKSTKPINCECCGKEFSFSDLPQEVLSIYRTKEITWVCSDCAEWANKEVRYAQTMASDIQRTYVKRSLVQRKQAHTSSVYKNLEVFDPVKKITKSLYIEVFFIVLYLIILLMGLIPLFVTKIFYVGLLFTLPILFVVVFALYDSYKRLTRLVNSIIVECNLKGEEAIHQIIDISNERLAFTLGKDDALDAAKYEAAKIIIDNIHIKPYSPTLNKKAP